MVNKLLLIQVSLPHAFVCSSSRSGKLNRDLPSGRWAGVIGVRSLVSSLTVVSDLELITA